MSEHPPPPSGPPPGWYAAPGEDDLSQWWDGRQWTDHFVLKDQAQAAPPGRDQPSAGTVAGGFKFGCGFFLFVFVGLPLLLLGGCGVLVAAGDHSSLITLYQLL